MTSLFIAVLNMSIAASFVAVIVLLGRLILRRAPKVFSYALWSAVAVRLLLPVSFAASFSFFRLFRQRTLSTNSEMVFVSSDMGLQKNAAVDAGMRELSRMIETAWPTPVKVTSYDLMQLLLGIGSAVWAAGAALMLLYGAVSYARIQFRVRTATRMKDNVYESDQISAPFVTGFLRPRIYVPTGLGEQELSCVVLHEQTHIRRRDHWIKPLAFAMLAVHWFNPLMWLSYSLMSKDMEMSCDESVVQSMGGGQNRKKYSSSLLALSMRRSGLMPSGSLGFGERNVKARIQNILAYRHPSTRRMASYLLVIAVLIVGCTANPKAPLQQAAEPVYYEGYRIDRLMKNKTPYIGDASKVGGLIDSMPELEGIRGNGIQLQTASPPYGLTVRYQMDDDEAVKKDGAISGDAFFSHTVLLFSLIDNADSITHSIEDRTGRYDGAVYEFTWTREQIEQQLGQDVRTYAEDEAGLRSLIDRLTDDQHT